MNRKIFLMLSLTTLLCTSSQTTQLSAQEFQSNSYSSTLNTATNLNIGIVNTKKCLEESKLGKQEQENFEKMKTQMESVLQEKEKALEEIEEKLGDDEWIDSVSDEAVDTLRRKRKAIKTEGTQLQSQYMQTLQQVNIKIIQKLTDAISKACEAVAKEGINEYKVDAIFTDEACTYFDSKLDISDAIVTKMNTMYDADSKKTNEKK